MVACRYGISLLVFNSTSHSFVSAHSWAIEWITRIEIPYPRSLIYYSLFIVWSGTYLIGSRMSCNEWTRLHFFSPSKMATLIHMDKGCITIPLRFLRCCDTHWSYTSEKSGIEMIFFCGLMTNSTHIKTREFVCNGHTKRGRVRDENSENWYCTIAKLRTCCRDT